MSEVLEHYEEKAKAFVTAACEEVTRLGLCCDRPYLEGTVGELAYATTIYPCGADLARVTYIELMVGAQWRRDDTVAFFFAVGNPHRKMWLDRFYPYQEDDYVDILDAAAVEALWNNTIGSEDDARRLARDVIGHLRAHQPGRSRLKQRLMKR